MAKIIIKKKLDLEFLGNEYKDSSLTFRAVPISSYKELTEKLSNVKEGDNVAATQVMLSVLKEFFVDGVFLNEKVVSDDLDDLDGTTIIKCFETLTGQVTDKEGNRGIDPKDESSSTTQSSMEPEPQANS